MRHTAWGGRVVELARYYQAGIVNTIFGFSLYSFLVWVGIGIFVSQTISHIIGMMFNYFTYKKHVFRKSDPAKFKFFLSYSINYILSISSLFLISRIILSPYAAGLISALLVSVINYFFLKFIVFKTKIA